MSWNDVFWGVICIQAITLIYLMFGPDTPFKQGFISGLTLEFIRKWFRKY